MTTHVIKRGAGAHAHFSTAARTHLAWLLGGFALGFLVPFVFADTLDLPRDLLRHASYYVVADRGRSSDTGVGQRASARRHSARWSAVIGYWHSGSRWPREPSLP